MRINHISVSTLPVLYRYGGAIQRRIVELANEQALQGHSVRVYSVGDRDENRRVAGVDYHFLRCRTALPWRHFEFQGRAVRAMGRGPRADVLHFHSQPEGAVFSKCLPGKKVLSYDYFAFRGGRKTPLHHLYKRMLKCFDLLLPCSDYCLKESRSFWQLPPARLRVLYNGVNTQQFRPEPDLRTLERQALGIHGRVVLYVGRVCQQKGTDLLLDAFRLLNRKRTDLQLVVAGPVAQFGHGGGPGGWPDQIAEVGGLYLGAVEEERLAAIYNLADVFVMPTRELEMFGMAAAEAQACGKPVIASDCGGLPEVVPESCGARFPAGDAPALARQIERVVDDPAWSAACAANAVQNAARFRWREIAHVLDQYYQAV